MKSVIDEIYDYLVAMEWLAPDETTESSFSAVFTEPFYKGINHGGLFACVYETSGSGERMNVIDFEMDNTITIDICYSWAGIEGENSHVKRSEAGSRLRHAWDNVKVKLFKNRLLEGAIASLDNATIELTPNYEVLTSDELNLKLYRITFVIKEVI